MDRATRDCATRSDCAPPWSDAGRHAMSPVATHDETARFNFIANFVKHLSSSVVGGNADAFVARAAPRWEREHGRPPGDRHEIAAAMRADPYHRFWAALRRTGMEMRQQAGRALVLRQARSLRDRARELNAGRATLQLDPAVRIPRYQAEVHNHCMPGSYFAEHIEDDVSAPANYDAGMFATTAGLFGRYLDGAGRGTVRWLAAHRPAWRPRRILDLGCGLGHNTLPLAQAFPEAEVLAIDVAAPMLRYGHARAVGMGIGSVVFRQADAEAVAEPDGSFDLVYSSMFLHETSHTALRRILAEATRLVAPGGLQLHLEQPPYRGMPPFEQFLRDWDCRHNNEPFWSALHETDLPALLASLGSPRERIFESAVHAVVDDAMPKVAEEVEDFGRGGMWYAVGAERAP